RTKKRRATGPPSKPFEVVLLCGAIGAPVTPPTSPSLRDTQTTRHQPRDPSRVAAASQHQPFVKVNRSLRPRPAGGHADTPPPLLRREGLPSLSAAMSRPETGRGRKGKGASCREALVEPVALFLLERAARRAAGARTERDRARRHPRRAG